MARACTAAARELIAARKLIAGYEQHIEASNERIKIADRQIEALKEKGALETLRVSEFETVIAAERQQIKILLGKIDLQERRIKQLEKSLSRSRKFTLFLGAAAAVGILIAVAK